MEPITFRASFPPIQSAFKRHGGGDGFRVQFDIPESDMENAAALMALTGVVLRVTVELEKQMESNYGESELEEGNQRKPRW